GGARSGAGARPVGRVGGAWLGGGGRRSSGGGRGGVSPTHGGGRPAAARSVGLGARPAPTSRTAPWARGGPPRPGAGGRQVVALASALVAVVGLPVAWVAAVVWARLPATGGVPPSSLRRILVVGCVGLCVLPAAGPLIGQMTVAVGVCRLGGGPLKTSRGS